tara:strand:- start:1125 stop:1829 length:705 start_codon:yes stop_codon:yes gene_type:complete
MQKSTQIERLSKVIARNTSYSRRQAEKLIDEGRVSVDGKKIISQGMNVSENNKIFVDKKLINRSTDIQIYIFHKPKGCLVTHNDPSNRKTIFDFINKKYRNLITVGRLDYNSEGLLILTNDGQLKREFELPKNNYQREYKVKIQGKITDFIISKISKGITVKGQKYKSIEIKKINETSTYTWIRMILTEGKNREIRKIFDSLNMTVTRLIRVSYGKYRLGKLQKGGLIKVKHYS